jgi:transcriptional regulator with XRE-family HTH domain
MGNGMQNLNELNEITAKAVKSSGEIGEIVSLHREKANLTQLELAKLSGVGKTVIFDIEKGKSTVKLETLFKVFKSLNITIALDSPIIDALVKSK